MPNTDLTNQINEIKQKLIAIRSQLMTEVTPFSKSGEDMPKMLWKIVQYEQGTLYRAVDEVESILASWEHQKLLSAALLARSLIENTSQYILMYDTCNKFINLVIDLKELDETLMKLIFGNKSEIDNSSDRVDPFNVLSVIGKADKYYWPNKMLIRKSYNDLCEVAHPNWFGKMNLYSRMFKDEGLMVKFSNSYGWEKSCPHSVCNSTLAMLIILIDINTKFDMLKSKLRSRFIELKIDFNPKNAMEAS